MLDVRGGSGRLAIALAERGIPVMLVDPSPAMVDAMRIKFASRPALHRFLTGLNCDPSTVQLTQRFSG